MTELKTKLFTAIPILAFMLSVGAFYTFGTFATTFASKQEAMVLHYAPDSMMKGSPSSSTALAVAVPPLSVETQLLWARIGVSAITLIVAVFIIFSRRDFSPSGKTWAYAMIGTIVGFWLK